MQVPHKCWGKKCLNFKWYLNRQETNEINIARFNAQRNMTPSAFRLIPCKPHFHCDIQAAIGQDSLLKNEVSNHGSKRARTQNRKRLCFPWLLSPCHSGTDGENSLCGRKSAPLMEKAERWRRRVTVTEVWQADRHWIVRKICSPANMCFPSPSGLQRVQYNVTPPVYSAFITALRPEPPGLISWCFYFGQYSQPVSLFAKTLFKPIYIKQYHLEILWKTYYITNYAHGMKWSAISHIPTF